MEIILRAWDDKHKCMAVQGTPDLETIQSFIFHYGDRPIMEYIEIDDCKGNKIFADDIMRDTDGTIFRIYKVAGGFAIKAKYWASNCKDLDYSDYLILEPLAHPQNAAWLSQCEIIGNIYTHCPNCLDKYSEQELTINEHCLRCGHQIVTSDY